MGAPFLGRLLLLPAGTTTGGGGLFGRALDDLEVLSGLETELALAGEGWFDVLMLLGSPGDDRFWFAAVAVPVFPVGAAER